MFKPIPPPHPPPKRATNYCLSSVYIHDFALHTGIRCEYCSSLNNATKFDNCHSCGAPLGSHKTFRRNTFK